MSDKPPSRSSGEKKRAQPTRKLNFTARVRTQLRFAADSLLGADVGWSLALVLLALLLFGNQRCATEIEPMSLGEIARQDIVAPEDLLVIDAVLTEERREQERLAVPDVYVQDTERSSRMAADMSTLFQEGRTRLAESGDLNAAARRALLEGTLEGRVSESALIPLSRQRFAPELEHTLTAGHTPLNRVIQRSQFAQRIQHRRQQSEQNK